MSENPIINSPVEGEASSSSIPTSSSTTTSIVPNKSPNANPERRRSIDKKIDQQNCKESITESLKNSNKDATINSTSSQSLSRISSKEANANDVNDDRSGGANALEDSGIQKTSPPRRRKSAQDQPLEKLLPPDDKVADKVTAENINDITEVIDETSLEQHQQTSSTTYDGRSEVDDSEVGIVGPPTAAEDVLNDDELLDPPNKDGDDDVDHRIKIDSHVTEWIERSSSSMLNKKKSNINHNTSSNNNNKRNNTNKNNNNGNSSMKNIIPKDVVALQQQPTRKSQRIVTSIIKRSIKCLNKMHAMDCGTASAGNGKDMEKKEIDGTNDSPKVPQNRQNGAALPEETATATTATRGRVKVERHTGSTTAVKNENHTDDDDEDHIEVKKKTKTTSGTTRIVTGSVGVGGSSGKEVRKRRSTEETFSSNGNPKRICFEQRERFIDSLVGCERISAEELATRAEELRAEVQALDELARAKEMEWNEILSMRKLKEEAYLRVERKRQVMGFLESNNGQMSDSIPPASLSLMSEWDESSRRDVSQERPPRNTIQDSSVNNPEIIHDERMTTRSRLEVLRENLHATDDDNAGAMLVKSDNDIVNISQKPQRNIQGLSSKAVAGDSGSCGGSSSSRKLRRTVEQSLVDNRQIGEGRQGPIVDVRSIIADYRLRHPETVPRRGRRMRNSVNVHLGAGGAMVDTSHGDSRPSSTDSCKSNSNVGDVNNPMSFKDVLVQFAKLSQQQGEPVKTPQNYPDVTLHPVAPSAVSMNSTASSQQTGSLLHGILTKSQSPRPTTFSPTLARLLTAPERERNSPSSGGIGQQGSQHLLQAYQGANPVSISDLLSSSKARTEITITPVVNPQIQSSHANNVVHVDDVEEENSLVEERDTRRGTSARDNREDRDAPPRCQGCHERAAQFVCAGCGNQWYCSRECQVSAWDEHSEVCSG